MSLFFYPNILVLCFESLELAVLLLSDIQVALSFLFPSISEQLIVCGLAPSSG